MENNGTYKKFESSSVHWEDVLTRMNSLYGRSPYDSDFNSVAFWDEIEEVRMQGFREAIEVLEEMDRADHMATRYISVLKQLHDAAVLSSKPPTKRRASWKKMI